MTARRRVRTRKAVNLYVRKAYCKTTSPIEFRAYYARNPHEFLTGRARRARARLVTS